MHFRHFLAASAASLSLACALATPAMAQETTSTIRGVVTSDGKPVAGAIVEIKDTNTGAKSTVTTTGAGGFDVSGLRAGDSYTVTVSASGYATNTVTDVVTVLAQAYEVPIELTAEGQEIVVSAARLQGAGSISQGPTTVLSANDIAQTASINRDIRDLSRRDPFARLDDSPTGGRAISFAGQNARYNRFSVDGVAITDSFGLNTDGLPSRRSPIPFDAIGQFQAKVAPYDVREGNFQGGSVNIVLRSGTNKWQGTAFAAYSADELTGKNTKAGPGVPTGHVVLPNFTYKNFGAEISGPIIEDKLFFMIAGERLRAPLPIPEGTAENNAGTAIPTLTQAQVDLISSIAKSKYGYDTGGVAKTNGDKDDRIVAKLDWNISDRQRASLSYTYAKDSIILGVNNFTTAPFGLSLLSNDYISSNRLHTGVFQLNSDWSDNFSTEVRGFIKDYKRGQDPALGRGFANFQVCTQPTSDRDSTVAGNALAINCNTTTNGGYASVYFGPDVSRQTNALRVKTYGGLLQGRLKAGDHDVKIFAEFQDVKTFNSFLQRSAGDYYFDSIADFQAGNAQRYRYGNAVPTLVPEDAAASFRYQGYTFGIQDNWRVTDALTVNAGLRYDLYGGNSLPALNVNFLNRYGFPNTKYVNGLDLFQPRFGFTWKPINTLTIRGGAGIFGGGTPDVYVSNSFSNTGVLTNTIDISQNNNGTYGGVGVNATNGAAILTNVQGTTIPGAANTLLTNATLNTLAPTNALAKNFKLPSQWRLTLSADWQPEDLGPLGGGWSFGADFLYSRVREQVFFTDLRVKANGLLTPDGRARYTPVTSFTDTNSDILLANSNQGRGYIGVVRASKVFDFGLEANVAYTYSNVKDRNPATSSTASSNYGAGVALDANGPAYGISNDEVRDSIKFDVSFNHAFFGDYKTTLALFGESRSGHPFSYTFRDTATRSTVFGTIGTGTRYLLYVPTGINDPKVSYANATDAQLFDDYLNKTGLSKYRGQIAPRNGFRSAWVTRLDLHFAQELPTFVGDAKFQVFMDIENFTNLLNKNWGQIREYAFPYSISPVQVTCLTTPVATGAPNATVTAATAQNAGQACQQYRYTANQTSGGQFTAPTDTIYAKQSLYAIRIGARISF